MSVIRTYACEHCGREFDSWDKMPECPDCGCVRTQWVPKGGHIAGISRRGDAEFRELVNVFKLDDLHSAKRDEAAKVIRHPAMSGAQPQSFGGFVANINPEAAVTQQNPSGAECVPVANNINFKTKLGIGSKFGAGKLGVPSVQAATSFEAQDRRKP